jgi:hypothetical protein
MMAPFIGFMSYPGELPGERGDLIMQLGRTIDISFSLEASGELTTPPWDNGEWASDTAEPIVGYFLESLAGDTDFDCDVDFTDFNNLANNYTGSLDPGTGGKLWKEGDFDGDGDVDFVDFNELANHYTGPGDGCKGLPEPSTLILLAIAALSITIGWWRQKLVA